MGLFRNMLKLILEPILGSERPKRAKMSPKEPSGASKNQKPSFSKTLKPIGFLKVFGYRGLSRKPQEAEEGSQKAPKKSKTPKNRNPKSNPKIIKNENQFLEPTLKPSTAKINQKKTRF